MPDEGADPLTINDYQWSDDGTRLLVFTNTKKVWRRNTRGDYWLLHLKNGTLQKARRRHRRVHHDVRQVLARRQPGGVGELRRQGPLRPGPRNPRGDPADPDEAEHVINGTTDWVYEEEFHLRDGFRWSPDGRHIAYWQFDSAGVGTFYLINNTDSVYPELTRPIPYPKVGTTNSACRVGVVPAGGGDTTWFEPEGDPRITTSPRWVGRRAPGDLAIQLNRLQNTARMMLGDISDGALKTVFTDRDDAWVDLHDDPQWLEDGRFFTWLSERDGWRHLYLVARDGSGVPPRHRRGLRRHRTGHGRCEGWVGVLPRVAR